MSSNLWEYRSNLHLSCQLNASAWEGLSPSAARRDSDPRRTGGALSNGPAGTGGPAPPTGAPAAHATDPCKAATSWLNQTFKIRRLALVQCKSAAYPIICVRCFWWGGPAADQRAIWK